MLSATLLALGSAVVHATWNLLIKTGDDRSIAAWGQFLAAALLATVGMCVVGFPGWAATPYLVGTGVVHVQYMESLVGAYRHGDFSMSYPLARGTGAVVAAVLSVIVLDDHLRFLSWVAIVVATVGLASLRVGAVVPVAEEVLLGSAPPARDQADRALGYALLTGLCIAVYSIIDSAGSRAVDSGVSYGFAATASAGYTVTLWNLARPARRARASMLVDNWRRNLLGGAGIVTAYTLVLVAVRSAPVGYVTMLRESSVVFGAVVGWLWLGESLGKQRLVSSAVILAGLIMLVAVS